MVNKLLERRSMFILNLMCTKICFLAFGIVPHMHSYCWNELLKISSHFATLQCILYFFFKFELDVHLMRLHLIVHSWTVSNGMKLYGGCLEIRKENSCKIAISVVYTYQIYIGRNNVDCKYCEQTLLKETLNCNPFSIIKYIFW